MTEYMGSDNIMSNYDKVLEMREQEKLLLKQRENIEDMLEEIYFRIDQLTEAEQKLQNEAIELHN